MAPLVGEPTAQGFGDLSPEYIFCPGYPPHKTSFRDKLERAVTNLPTQLADLPKPDEYRSASQYRDALRTWERVGRRLAERGPIGAPPMPVPDDYRSASQYREALRVWERTLRL